MNDYPFLHSVLSPELWFAKSLPMVIYTEQSISSKPSLSLSVSPPASLTQLPQFLSNQTCCLWTLLWQKPVFTVSSCIRHKANVTAMLAKQHGGHYLPLAQFWTCQCVRSVDSVGELSGGGLAASYTRTSADSDSTLLSSRIRISSDSVRTHLVSLIHNSQFRCTERDRTAGKIPVQLPVRCRSKSACFLRYVVKVSSAVIGSGVHMTMVAIVSSASGICKAFLK